MPAFDCIQGAVKQSLTPHRWRHTLGVVEAAGTLAGRFEVDPERARLAGLLHDFAREIPPAQLLAEAKTRGLEIDAIESAEPLLLHGKVGAAMAAERFDLTDPELLAGIAYHITGRPAMTPLEKLLFLADFIEPNRSHAAAVRVRTMAAADPAGALLAAFDAVIVYVVRGGYLLHPRTVAARNELVLSEG